MPVVERQRLKDLLAEQKLTAGALADEDTRLRLGKIIGAQRMVFGGFFVLGDAVQVHVRVIDTATSRVLFSDEAATPLAGVMAQVAPMNQRLAAGPGRRRRPGRGPRRPAHPQPGNLARPTTAPWRWPMPVTLMTPCWPCKTCWHATRILFPPNGSWWLCWTGWHGDNAAVTPRRLSCRSRTLKLP